MQFAPVIAANYERRAYRATSLTIPNYPNGSRGRGARVFILDTNPDVNLCRPSLVKCFARAVPTRSRGRLYHVDVYKKKNEIPARIEQENVWSGYQVCLHVTRTTLFI